MRQVEYAIVQGDATTYAADVLAMKYARHFYGVDQRVSTSLTQRGYSVDSMRPEVGSYAFLDAKSAVGAQRVLFLGTPSLQEFGYAEIRKFAKRVLTAVAQEAPATSEIAMTLHGTGYGLDEIESCLSEFDGCLDALLDQREASRLNGLRRITILERDPTRISRIRDALLKYVMATNARIKADQRGEGVFALHIPDANDQAPARTETTVAPDRLHAFVAMPFSPHMMDVFYYGIQRPVRDAGLICERIDHESFIGDIMQWMRERISTASVIVAELTGANPNVYLEVGYAWGKDKPVILVSKDTEEVAFDVRGHRRIMYDSIYDLEQKLGAELKALRDTHRL